MILALGGLATKAGESDLELEMEAGFLFYYIIILWRYVHMAVASLLSVRCAEAQTVGVGKTAPLRGF